MNDDVSQLERDLDQARESLQQTFAQVHQKVETVGTRLPHPRQMVRRNPLMWIAGATAAGFLAGMANTWGDRFAFLLMGAFFGSALQDFAARHDYKSQDEFSTATYIN